MCTVICTAAAASLHQSDEQFSSEPAGHKFQLPIHSKNLKSGGEGWRRAPFTLSKIGAGGGGVAGLRILLGA